MSDIKLYQGDCLEHIKSLDAASVDLIVTDPPYKVTPKGCAGTTGGMIAKKQNMIGMVFEHNDIEPEAYAPEFYRVLKDGSHCYVMTNHVNLINMLNSFSNVGFHFIKSLIWKKDNKIMGRFYMSQFEYILFFRKGRGVQINNCGTGDVLEVPNKKHKDADGKNLHDTEKPVELMEILVENSSKPGDVVMDPFMGVGSTGIACKHLDRNFIGIELDPNYFELAKSRIENATFPIKLF
jgi:site-specific DNA-methyltransferase (adenine-specific)